jgi:hypothetical protein
MEPSALSTTEIQFLVIAAKLLAAVNSVTENPTAPDVRAYLDGMVTDELVS